MDSLVEAKEDIDEIGGALATDIIPDANLFDQGLYCIEYIHFSHFSTIPFQNLRTNLKIFSNLKKRTI